ncbi:BamA/TamA family outer membrane protein [Shewanella gaetbuli]
MTLPLPSLSILRKNLLKSVFIILLSFTTSHVFAQDELLAAVTEDAPELAAENSWFENFLNKLGADGEFDADKLIDFSILPGPFYNPEMNLGVGVSAIGLYQIDPEDDVSQLSSLVINGLASVNGALGVGIHNKTFIKQDTQRLYIDAGVYNVPDVYYGVGYDNNHNDDNKVKLNSRSIEVNPMYLARVSEHVFVGGGFDFRYSEAEDIDILESLIPVDNLFESSTSAGFNFHVSYDSRDNVLNPQQGKIAQLDVGVYREDLGGKTDFEVFDALYSTYYSVHSDDVLAWQIRGRFTHGDVPWDQLSKVGGGELLRGYTTGRYRDKQMLLAQVEYRLNLPWRHGMVFWAGAGVISDQFSELLTSNLLPNTGVGYRFEVKPKVNLRLDLAFGDGDTGFYFNVNEAF